MDIMTRCFKYGLMILTVWTLWMGNAWAVPSFKDVQKAFVKSDSLLLDRHGDILHELRTDHQRRRLDWTPLQEISPSLTAATLASEDARFYQHGGVDYPALGAAAASWITGERKRGASTITMQVASLIDSDLQIKKNRRSFTQKIRQIKSAWDLEKSWRKEQILEAYLNLVTFRGEYQGIAAASRGFFDREPHGLTQAQSLILASLIRAPNATPEALLRRALKLNQSLSWPGKADELLTTVHALYPAGEPLRPRANLAPHVARQLFKDPARSSTITCTIDRLTQKYILEQLSQQIDALERQNVKEGAVLVLDNKTGEVLSYVSYSRQPGAGGFVDGVRAKRQAGSTLKPLLYAAALDAKILTAASVLDDSPLDVAVASGIYQPGNYDSSFKGPVRVRVALASSLNVPAVRVLSLVGIDSFLTRLRQLGIRGLDESGDYYGLSLALGSVDVSLWELTNAFRALANSGSWSAARLTQTLEKDVLPVSQKVFSGQAAFIVSDILSDRKARSTTFGLENPLSTRFWTAVKTGTSKDMRDNWCIGYSSRFTIGVWVGNFSGEPMWNVSGLTGAAPVWITAMNYLHRHVPGTKPALPRSLKKVRYASGENDDEEDWFIAGTEPSGSDYQVGQQNLKILYPPSGAILALDPDIPPALQKVFFTAQMKPNDPLQWMLNDHLLADCGKTIAWTPIAGKYTLAIINRENKVMDQVNFEVRGGQND